MNQPVNPYVAGAPLRGKLGFFGRKDILDWVVHGLHNQDANALVLFGQRLVGKTSILLRLERILPYNAFLPIYFSLEDQAHLPLGQVLADLADTTAERVGLEPPNWDDFDSTGLFFRRRFLPQLYQALGENRRPVFLLDECDVLDKVDSGELSDTAAVRLFFSFLRRTMTEDTYPIFVFAIGRLVEELSPALAGIFRTSLRREVQILDRGSAEALIRQAETNGTLCFTDRAVERVLGLTNGHPYLTQLLCQRLWELAHSSDLIPPPWIDLPDVEIAIPDTLKAGDSALIWIWDSLSPAEKIYAAALARLTDEGISITKDQVVRVCTAHAAGLRTWEEAEAAFRSLVKRQLLEEVEGQQHRFAVELFRRWVYHRGPPRDREVNGKSDRIESSAERLFHTGRISHQRGEWEKATRYFRNALKADPYHLRARLLLGETLLEQGQIDEAVTELRFAYELDEYEASFPLSRALLAQAERVIQKGQAAMRSRSDATATAEMLAKEEEPLILSPTITWLHLSDLHLRTSQTYDSSIVLKALLRDITECICEYDLRLDFAVLSGDIAFASRSEEYALAQQFLDDLLKTTGLPKPRLFLVPGNHDIDRSAISILAAGAKSILKSRDAVNSFLASDADRLLVFQRFHNYQDFINEYMGDEHPHFDSAHYFHAETIQASGLRVGILGLNSTWLAASDEDRGRLLLGERQVRAALDTVQQADLHLAVMHHPFDWLQDFDRDDAEALLYSGCDFVLHGHMHQVGLPPARTPDIEALIIAAGACYETRQHPNSYNFVRLDLSAGRGTVYLRMYSDRQGGFWTKDVMNYHNVKNGVYGFPLPARLHPHSSNLHEEPKVPITPGDSRSGLPTTASSPAEDTHTNWMPIGHQLRQVLAEHFDLEELHTLCFDLGVDYDRLGGEGKEAKARELVAYLQRRGQLERLIAAIQRERGRIG